MVEDGVVVAEDDRGALVVGSEADVAAFIAQWELTGVDVVREVAVQGVDGAAALSLAADVGAAGATAARYVALRSDVPRGGSVVIRKWVTGPDGRIVSNKPVHPAQLVGTANPALLLGVVGVRMAIADATATVVAAVEQVGDTADEVLRLAGAQRAGDVLGHHRLLRRRVEALDAGAELGDTGWSAVAGLGPVLEVGVERLRHYAERLAADLPSGVKADERADRLRRVVETGRLGEVLRLLVIAEQSLYLWQRLRIERVRATEPHLLEQAVADAHATLVEHLRSDGELVAVLRVALPEYGTLQALEYHRVFSGRRLQGLVAALQNDLDAFVTARGMQAEGWAPLTAPTARDAVRAARDAALGTGRAARALGGRAFDTGLAGIGRAGGAVQAGAERLRRRGTDDGAKGDDGADPADPAAGG